MIANPSVFLYTTGNNRKEALSQQKPTKCVIFFTINYPVLYILSTVNQEDVETDNGDSPCSHYSQER